MIIVKILLIALLSIVAQANNNCVTDIVKISQKPLYNLDKEDLRIALIPFLKKNVNIKALKIVEAIDKDDFLIFYRDKERFVFDKEIPQSIKKLQTYESEIKYDNEIIGKLIVYVHHNLSTLDLTPQEISYLEKKDSLKICIDKDWYPLEAIKNSKYVGISSDYMDIFSKKIGLPIKIIDTKDWSDSLAYAKERKCDVLPFAMKTPNREKYMDFTTVYFTSNLVVVGLMQEQFVGDITQLLNKKIGITKDGAYYELLKNKYKNINLVEISNLTKGLELVNSGQLDGYIGSLDVLGKQIQDRYSSDIKVIARLNENWELTVATRNDEPLLHAIFQKAIEQLREVDRNAIKNKYLALTIENKIDYSFIWKLVAIVFMLVLLVLYRQFLLRKVNKQLKELVGKLEEDEIQLKLLASTDPLTKLYNRRYFSNISEHIFDLAIRDKNDLSILMLDIDKFKNINDTYGHTIGDTVLVGFSKILKGLTRKSDVICRWGGEEFIILLPQTTIHGASAIAEKIRKKIQNNVIIIEDKREVRFTVSIGVAIIDNEKDLNLEASIQRADKALYEAKESGRNKVIIGTY